MTKNFTPIRVSVLRGDQKISFDVFVEIGGKHIHYLRRGESFEGARLKRLREKKLKKMYILAEEEQAYRDYLTRNMDMAYDAKSSQTLENRSQVIHGLQQNAAEQMFEDPTNSQAYAAAKAGTDRFTEFLLREDQAIKNLLAVENVDQSITHHGVTVSTLAVEICKSTGYQDKRNIPVLALGGLLHDLGHQLSGQSIAHKIEEFSPADLELYKSHPSQAVLKLKDLKHMDLHVIQIIGEHEENLQGTGFPEKLKEKQMNVLSSFVQTANAFDRLVTFEKMSPKDAVKFLLTNRIGLYPLAFLNALKVIAS